ncbi:MAG: hypothetical protein CM15mP130_0960 [Verrucomicrobiota bacterium]|nr:MAG: hypothetical protein CM15mP130_0960 [Verrucomicrobiota bacterium]
MINIQKWWGKSQKKFYSRWDGGEKPANGEKKNRWFPKGWEPLNCPGPRMAPMYSSTRRGKFPGVTEKRILVKPMWPGRGV